MDLIIPEDYRQGHNLSSLFYKALREIRNIQDLSTSHIPFVSSPANVAPTQKQCTHMPKVTFLLYGEGLLSLNSLNHHSS